MRETEKTLNFEIMWPMPLLKSTTIEITSIFWLIYIISSDDAIFEKLFRKWMAKGKISFILIFYIYIVHPMILIKIWDSNLK